MSYSMNLCTLTILMILDTQQYYKSSSHTTHRPSDSYRQTLYTLLQPYHAPDKQRKTVSHPNLDPMSPAGPSKNQSAQKSHA